jgi:hypothetical protein
VGINLQPQVVFFLRNLGLLHELEEQGIQTSVLVYMNCHGQQILAEKSGKGLDTMSLNIVFIEEYTYPVASADYGQ